jgi:hypothetical protein
VLSLLPISFNLLSAGSDGGKKVLVDTGVLFFSWWELRNYLILPPLAVHLEIRICYLALSYCNRLPELIDLIRKKVYFGSQF